MGSIELGFSVTHARALAGLASLPLDAPSIARFLGDARSAELLPEPVSASHLYFGSEFCEHLFPEQRALERAIRVADKRGLILVLATPIANDALVARILSAIALLPDSAEVLVNDWGVASAVRAAQPQRRLAAGRQLAKMMKDPRVPSPAWMKPYPSGYDTGAFRSILARLGIEGIELDVPPFATPETFALTGLTVTVRAPFAYVAKGRICKIGSLRQPAPEKFAPGRPCNQECLGVHEVGAAASAAGLMSYAKGNSIYYRHNDAMTQALRAALVRGHVSRLVLAGI